MKSISVGGGNVTPSPTPDFSKVSYNCISGEFLYNSQQIQGITTTITLKVKYNDFTPIGSIWFNLNEEDQIGIISNIQPPSAQEGFTGLQYNPIGNNETFTVNPDQFVSFGLEGNFLIDGNYTVEVVNVSDSDALLDTFLTEQINCS